MNLLKAVVWFWALFVFSLPVQAQNQLSRHPDAGIWVAYRGENTPENLQKSYIKGVMAYSFWKKLYVGQNTFAWGGLDTDLDFAINQAHKKAFVVVAAGYCPKLDWPDFLKEEIASHKDLNNQGCHPLQFWDPLYVQYYKQYIAALADHLAEFDSSDNYPNQTNVLFVRAQVMADTMENLPNDYGNWQWTDFDPAPSGRIYKVDLTEALVHDYQLDIALAYKQELKRAYSAKGLTPPVPVAKAGGYWGPEFNSDAFIQEGIWFDEHSGAPNPQGWYYSMVGKVKAGQTRGTSETGGHWPPDLISQYTYWEVLANLHSGVEFIGIYGKNPGNPDLQPQGPVNFRENMAILKFGSKYAGHYRNPATSPGAWIALRGAYPENRWSQIEHSRLWSNYEFLITQSRPQDSVALFGVDNHRSGSKQLVPIVSRNSRQPWVDEIQKCQERFPVSECEYLYQKPGEYLGFDTGTDKYRYTYAVVDLGKIYYCSDQVFCPDPEGATREETMLWARRTDKQNNHNYMRFDVDGRFAESLGGKAILRIVYLDQGRGSWQLQYDSQEDPNKVALTVIKTGTNIWKEVLVDLDDINFDNRQIGGADLSLFNLGDDDDVFHLIEVQRVGNNAFSFKSLLATWLGQDTNYDQNEDGKVNSVDFAKLTF